MPYDSVWTIGIIVLKPDENGLCKYSTVTNYWKQSEEKLIDINDIANIFRVLSSCSRILLEQFNFTNREIRLAELSYNIIFW